MKSCGFRDLVRRDAPWRTPRSHLQLLWRGGGCELTVLWTCDKTGYLSGGITHCSHWLQPSINEQVSKWTWHMNLSTIWTVTNTSCHNEIMKSLYKTQRWMTNLVPRRPRSGTQTLRSVQGFSNFRMGVTTFHWFTLEEVWHAYGRTSLVHRPHPPGGARGRGTRLRTYTELRITYQRVGRLSM